MAAVVAVDPGATNDLQLAYQFAALPTTTSLSQRKALQRGCRPKYTLTGCIPSLRGESWRLRLDGSDQLVAVKAAGRRQGHLCDYLLKS
jgi:hypothetical protein